MITQNIRNRFSTDLIEEDLDIFSTIQDPSKYEKTDCPLWKFVTIKGEHKRKSENYDQVLCLELDFDGCISINEFKGKYIEYEYFLYTTSSHRIEGKDKFRVIIPLKETFSFSKYDDKIFLQCLMEFFPGLDKSCFKNFHHVPNKPNDEIEYEWYFNPGMNFDINGFNSKYEFLKKQELRKKQLNDAVKEIKKAKANKLTDKMKNGYKNKVLKNIMETLNQIPKHKSGNRYNMLLSITGKMVQAKYPDEEFIFSDDEVFDTITSHTDDPRVRHMIQDFITSRMENYFGIH